MLGKLVGIGVAGALGSLARYGLAGAVHRAVRGPLPWGTAVVNVLGCFVAGALWAAFQDRAGISGEMRAIILIGFMGGFTTFSTYMLETGNLVRDAQWGWAVGNMLFQNLVGLAGLFLGLMVGRLV
ncbi:fluoride efflux transporter CrcB [bacterium]|nr:fluoride efflux transporter CrcB [bacterium]